MKYIILVLLLGLSACSTITDFLLKPDTGINVDAQIGDTASKVKTGIGSVGDNSRHEHQTHIKGSQDVEVQNTSDRYHLTTEGNTTLNVYETNRWLYALFGLYIIGTPALRWLWNKWDSRRKTLYPHEYITYTTTRRRSVPTGDIPKDRYSSYNPPD